MSAHSHDQYPSEPKPVAFTVPLILAAVTILVMGLFLSLCDPEAHGHGTDGHAATEASAGGKHATDEDMQHHGEADGPPAHPSAPAAGQQHR